MLWWVSALTAGRRLKFIASTTRAWIVAGLYVIVFGACLSLPAPAHADSVVRAYTINVAPVGAEPLNLYAEERGHGAPIVLLHGLGGSSYSWRYIAPALARSHTVITVDLKGFGHSDKVFDTRYSAADQARLVVAFLVRRKLSGITLVGHSFGGQVALLSAILSGQGAGSRIHQLVLIDVPALPQPLTPLVALMQKPVVPYILLTAIPSEISTRIALAADRSTPFARPYTDADADAYAAPFREAAARHAYIQTARQIAPSNLDAIVARYRSVRQRTLLVWCAADRVVPVATGETLVRMLPHAKLELLEGCNHAPPDEAPAALNRSLLGFLKPSHH